MAEGLGSPDCPKRRGNRLTHLRCIPGEVFADGQTRQSAEKTFTSFLDEQFDLCHWQAYEFGRNLAACRKRWVKSSDS